MKIIVGITLILSFLNVAGQVNDHYRPGYHFTPDKNWINDPCGMVYLDGEYHLMYQYNPFGTQWGNMSWGHAVSTDMVHWEELPVALTPDNLGDIFSGGAVVDKNNTAGFGENAIIAIYTSAGQQQQQSIAYSLDHGRSWTKYDNNPVLPNQGTPDFRDPMVFWHEQTSKWIMALAVSNRIEFYGSPDLKEWTYLSSFGQNIGAHGGVWECPDMFARKDQFGNEYWVLLVSINPGGPQGGSATQYFVGDFDGEVFSLHSSIQELLTKNVELPVGVVFEDFENGDYAGWTISGDAFGLAPASGTLDGQQEVTGFLGQGLVNSFLNGDVTTGSLTSPVFTIENDYISFLIGGGNHPDKTGISLIVDGESVLSATGKNAEVLTWNSWNVEEWKGKQATLEIIDLHSDGWGHINVDHIYFSDAPVIDDRIEALWADWGTDNYAGRSFENMPENDDRRIWMGWMNNWSYAGDIPTTTWRGAMTLPRTLELKTIDNIPYLVQEPIIELETLRNTKIFDLVSSGFNDLIGSLNELTLSDESYEMELEIEFSLEDEFEIGFLERLGFSTKLHFDASEHLLSLDRTTSGIVNFNNAFPGIFPVTIAEGNQVLKLRVFLDHSSIEIFVNDGATVLTHRVFPIEDSFSISANLISGNPTIKNARIWELDPINEKTVLKLNPLMDTRAIVIPNPVLQGEIFRFDTVHEDIQSFTIYDLQGRVVQADSTSIFANTMKISGISSGLYLIRAITNKEVYRAKVLIK